MRRGIWRFGSISDVYLPATECRFLHVSLNTDAILGEVTINQRRKLQEMTHRNGLSDAYMATLARLRAQKGNKPVLGMKVLMWVSHSERPLRAEELGQVLGVEIGSAYLDSEKAPALRILLESCLGLVTVEPSSSTLRLANFTLQDNLLSDPALFHNPHSPIVEVCLTSILDVQRTSGLPFSLPPRKCSFRNILLVTGEARIKGNDRKCQSTRSEPSRYI